MDAGDTFFLKSTAADGHLWVIISDPVNHPGRVLFVSMTSYDVTKGGGMHHKRGRTPVC